MAACDGTARLCAAREVWTRIYGRRWVEETAGDGALCTNWFNRAVYERVYRAYSGVVSVLVCARTGTDFNS